MTDRAPSSRAPVDPILVLRGIACLIVLLNHLVGKLTENFAIPPSLSWLAPFVVPYGFPCVWLFFTLSSFLLTTAFLQGRFTLDGAGIRHFFTTRARRLLPLFLLFQGVLLALWARGLTEFLPTSTLERELSVLLAAPWAPYSPRTQAVLSLNSPVWSVLLEFHFIFLLPLTIPLLRRTRVVHVLLIVLSAAAAATYGWRGKAIFPIFYQGHLYNFGFLALGQCLAWEKFHRPVAAKRPLLPALMVFTGIWVLLQYYAFQDLQRALAWGPAVFAAAVWLLLLRLDTSYQKKLPSSYREIAARLRPRFLLETLGAMSYSIYLCHKPLAYALIFVLGLAPRIVGLGSLAGISAGLTIVLLAISAVLYVEVENRFRYRAPAER